MNFKNNRSLFAEVHLSRRHLLKVAASMLPYGTVAGAGLVQACSDVAKQEEGKSTPAAADTDVVELSARAVIQHIKQGGMTAEFYVTQLLNRYRDFQYLNTVITLDETRVMENARAVDRARARGEKLGPVAGLPVMVKDQIEAAGYPTTAGTAALKGYMSTRNAAVLDTLLRNGAIMYAKANLQELAQGATSSNPTFGFVRNPYDPTRIPGGSSGGNAAALAARLVPAGLGEDSGGSIRIPAALCGIAGLRPSTGGTRKRYPDAGLVPPARPDDPQTIGPMARSVADVAFLDQVITGEGVSAVASVRNVRLAVPSADYWEREDVDKGLAQCMNDAFAKLQEAGVSLVEIDLDAFIDLGDRVAPALRSGNRDALFIDWLAQNLPGVTLAEVVAGITSKDVKASREARMHAAPTPGLSPQEQSDLRSKISAEYETRFNSTGAAAIAFPCVSIPAPAINPDGDSPGDQIEVNGKLLGRSAVVIRNTWWGARMGAPGLVVPVGLVSGLPVSMELEALPGDDSRLLGLGIAIEDILGTLPPPTYGRQT